MYSHSRPPPASSNSVNTANSEPVTRCCPRSPWYQARTRTMGRPTSKRNGRELLNLTRPIEGAAEVLQPLHEHPAAGDVDDSPLHHLAPAQFRPGALVLALYWRLVHAAAPLATQCSRISGGRNKPRRPYPSEPLVRVAKKVVDERKPYDVESDHNAAIRLAAGIDKTRSMSAAPRCSVGRQRHIGRAETLGVWDSNGQGPDETLPQVSHWVVSDRTRLDAASLLDCKGAAAAITTCRARWPPSWTGRLANRDISRSLQSRLLRWFNECTAGHSQWQGRRADRRMGH